MAQSIIRVCVPRFLQIGRGSLELTSDLMSRIGVKHPLIVTDATMVKAGYVDRLKNILSQADMKCGVFADVLPDPTDIIVLAAIDALDAGGYDSVIGLGGGSPIDTAKAVAVMSQHGRDLLSYRPPKQFDQVGLPIIAIPTTAGTGSEVTHHTVITHTETQDKISCRGEAFIPQVAILDYTLTLTKPPRLTADNALDTLAHAIEAYTSSRSSIFSDRMALDCMRLIGLYVSRAYSNGKDIEARENLLLASTMGGLAFSNASVSLVHAMSRPFGNMFHVPHGMSNAMLLPAVVEFSLSSAMERYADCGRAIGFADASDISSVAGIKLAEGLKSLTRRLNVPSMREFGIDHSEYTNALSAMAQAALRSGSPNNNPRIPNEEEIINLYQIAWEAAKG